ncbi:cytochrome-c peroxidase [Acetobacter persici]|uniref:cytochrome-c peroxidase n=1 Tax=Acetobacter persici TaxID=1076596 RepID=UPI001BAA361F|nr:cytochrome c peroxidase [Acetobacter persici]MBS1016711.1 cytochrome C peroxidase [Acetobacter persici]
MRPATSVLRFLAGVCLFSAAWGASCAAAPAQTPFVIGGDARASAASGPVALSEQEARIQLGRRLFYDADLSGDGSMACASCHEQRHAFADGMATHAGITDEAGVRNVPSLGNVGAFKTLTWLDQHITTLEQQMATPVFGHGPVEMGMPGWATLLHRVSGEACYQKLFAAAFKKDNGRIDARTVPQALAAFERTLISRNSLWDQAQKKQAVLPAPAQRGAILFFGPAQCAACHSGFLLSDQSFHKINTDHPARIRTPSLRNVGVTAPYLHDGSAPTLRAALQAHSHSPALSAQDEQALEAFLQTLTDPDFLHNPAFALPPETCPI